MDEELVVFDDVGPNGRRKLFVKRVGFPVEVERWLRRVPEASLPEVQVEAWEMGEGVIQWHCLRLEWPTRELVGLPVECVAEEWGIVNTLARVDGQVPAAMWTLAQGERLSAGLRQAVEVYWGGFDRWPSIGLVRKLTPGAPGTLELEGCNLKIGEAGWLWPRCVLVL